MDLTKPEDLKYSFCWHCDCYTARCPHCNGNACACGCHIQNGDNEPPCRLSKFWEAVEYSQEHNMEPTVVTEEEITKRLNCLRDYFAELSPEQRKENRKMGGYGLLNEGDYWQIQKYADKINMQIPTLEEFGKEVDVEPTYNCHTGKEFELQTNLRIVNPLGWHSVESFENERIPWVEYIERRSNSDCDYSQQKERTNCICVGDARPQERIRLYSGPGCGQTATIVKNDGNEFVTLCLDGSNENIEYYAYNQAMMIENK